MKYARQIGVFATLALTLNSPLKAISFSDIPLFIGSSVDPNLMFLLDDSGSMSWSFMPDEIFNACQNTSDVTQRARGRSHHVNALYFNPDIDYPAPLKADGTRFPDANYSSAWHDGYDQSAGTADLTTDFRATWYYQSFSSPNQYCGAQGPADYYIYDENCGDPDSNACYDQHLLSNEDAAARQNFANWYSYYRNRMFAARAGIGEAFADVPETFRLGWGQINSSARSIDDSSSIRAVREGVRVNNATRKTAFYDWLYNAAPNGDTPLRTALEGAGEYFEQSDRAWADDPSLAVVSGSNDMRACRQAFTILMTDGYYNGSNPSSSSTGADDSAGLSITNNFGSSFQYAPSAPFNDNRAGITLADVAMYYWKRDLKTGLDNLVPTTNTNPAFWQHMSTYGIGLGVSGSIDPDVALDAVANGDPIDWWSGTSNQNKINDLLHASVNGRGGFFSASDPKAFSSQLTQTINNITDEVATGAAVDFETASVQAGALAFSAQFDPNGWSGDIKAVKVTQVDPPVIPQYTPGNGWSAREKLNNRNLISDPRTILTFDGAMGKGFSWANLTANQKADLSVGVDNATAQKRLGYIRGDRDPTTIIADPAFHPRTFRLGSIVNSSPNFVGAPSSNWPDTGYASFRATYESRTPVVYAGSNDGMLHGFRATEDGGEEVLAYIPSFVYSADPGAGLHYLTEPNYSHRYYVDLETSEQDIYSKGRTSAGGVSGKSWRTVLIGGARAGAKGIFALDVTNPGQFSEGNAGSLALWEFSSADDSRLGYTIQPPTVAKAEWGSGDVRWTVFVSNGYNSTTATTGFFMLDAEGGLDGAWSEGSDYRFIEFEGGGSGLSPLIELDMTGDLVADRVYAGDLDGNVWVAENTGGGTWKSAYRQGAHPKALFTASVPITSSPEVTANYEVETTSSNQPNVNVYFGTGQYLESADSTSSGTQYIFGVWDGGTHSLDMTNLEARQFTESTLTSLDGNIYNTRKSTGAAIDYTAKHGWYIPLPVVGERIISRPIKRFISEDSSKGVVYFNSLIPNSDPCFGGGSGWLMAVGFTGLTPDEKPYEDFPESIAGFEVQGLPPTHPDFWGNYQSTMLSNGSMSIHAVPPAHIGGAGRRGWQEVSQ